MEIDDDDDELQRALELSREQAQPTSQPTSQPSTSAGVAIVGSFPTQFRCYAAAAAGRGDLDSTGRILLPTSCLRLFVSYLGELPPTLLLRLVGGDGAACYVGVAEFVDDDDASRMLLNVRPARPRQSVRADEYPSGDPLRSLHILTR